jgi:hypothetical protein
MTMAQPDINANTILRSVEDAAIMAQASKHHIVRTGKTSKYLHPNYVRPVFQMGEDMITMAVQRNADPGTTVAFDHQLAGVDPTGRFAGLVQHVTTARNRRSR